MDGGDGGWRGNGGWMVEMVGGGVIVGKGVVFRRRKRTKCLVSQHENFVAWVVSTLQAAYSDANEDGLDCQMLTPIRTL